jgi:hypothetical protein
MAEQGPPPRTPVGKLDFSQFHPLDHWPGSAYCRGLYGGTWNHLKMAWEYRWSGWLAGATLCRVGRHDVTTVWRRRRPSDEWTSLRVCRNCDYQPPEN